MQDLGIYNDFRNLLDRFPNGANDGDTATVGGMRMVWSEATHTWIPAPPKPCYGDMGIPAPPPPIPPVPPVPPTPVGRDVYGGLRVHGDLTVGGKLRTKGVKQPNLGLFKSLEALVQRYPHPTVGEWAVVGDTIPGEIYRCEAEGYWVATGETGGIDSVDINDIETRMEAVETANEEAVNKMLGGLREEEMNREGAFNTMSVLIRQLQSTVEPWEGLLRGTGAGASAHNYPQLNLGNVTSQQEVNTLLDQIFTSTDIKYNGRMRLTRNGALILIAQHIVNAEQGYWAQCVAGMLAPSSDGTSLEAANRYAVVTRSKDWNGTLTGWQLLGGGGVGQLKTINGQSLTGTGNIVIGSEGSITVDDTVGNSPNPVSGAAVLAAIGEINSTLAGRVGSVKSFSAFVTELPATGTDGDCVYHTTEKKFYTYATSAWNQSSPSTDILYLDTVGKSVYHWNGSTLESATGFGIVSYSALDDLHGEKYAEAGIPNLYIVTTTYNSKESVVGFLLLISCSQRHVNTQVLISHFAIENGALSGQDDGRVTILYRSYGLTSNPQNVPVGSWGQWKNVNAYLEDYVLSLQSTVSGLQSTTSGLQSTVSGLQTSVNSHANRITALEAVAWNGASGSGSSSGSAPGQDVVKDPTNQVGTVHVSSNVMPESSATTESTRYVITQNVSGQTGQQEGITLAAGSKIVPDGGLPTVPVTGGELSWVHSSDIGMIQDDPTKSKNEREAAGRINFKCLQWLCQTQYQLYLDGTYVIQPLPGALTGEHDASNNPEWKRVGTEVLGVSGDLSESELVVDYFRINLTRQLFLRSGKLICLSGVFSLDAGGGVVCEGVTIRRTMDTSTNKELVGENRTQWWSSTYMSYSPAFAFVKVNPSQGGLCGRLEFYDCTLSGRIVSSEAPQIYPKNSTDISIKVSLQSRVTDVDGHTYQDESLTTFTYPHLQCDAQDGFLKRASSQLTTNIQLHSYTDSNGYKYLTDNDTLSSATIMTLDGDASVYLPDDNGKYVFKLMNKNLRYSGQKGKFVPYLPKYDNMLSDGNGGYYQVQRFKRAIADTSGGCSHLGLQTFIVSGCVGLGATFSYDDMAVYNKWEVSGSKFEQCTTVESGKGKAVINYGRGNNYAPLDSWRAMSCDLIIRDNSFNGPIVAVPVSMGYNTPVLAETPVIHMYNNTITDYACPSLGKASFGELYDAYLSCREVYYHDNTIRNTNGVPMLTIENSKMKFQEGGNTGWMKGKGTTSAPGDADYYLETGIWKTPRVREYRNNTYVIDDTFRVKLEEAGYYDYLIDTPRAKKSNSNSSTVSGTRLYGIIASGSITLGTFGTVADVLSAVATANTYPMTNIAVSATELIKAYNLVCGGNVADFASLVIAVNNDVLGYDPISDVDDLDFTDSGLTSEVASARLSAIDYILDRICATWCMMRAHNVRILDMQFGYPMHNVTIAGCTLSSPIGELVGKQESSGGYNCMSLSVTDCRFDFQQLPSFYSGDKGYMFLSEYEGANVRILNNTFLQEGAPRRINLLYCKSPILKELRVDNNKFYGGSWYIGRSAGATAAVAAPAVVAADVLSVSGNTETGSDTLLGATHLSYVPNQTYAERLNTGCWIGLSSANDFLVETRDDMTTTPTVAMQLRHPNNAGTIVYRTKKMIRPYNATVNDDRSLHLMCAPASGQESQKRAKLLTISYTVGGKRVTRRIEFGRTWNYAYTYFYWVDHNGCGTAKEGASGNTLTDMGTVALSDIGITILFRAKHYQATSTSPQMEAILYTSADGTLNDPGTDIEIRLEPLPAVTVGRTGADTPVYAWDTANATPIGAFLPPGSLASPTLIEAMGEDMFNVYDSSGTLKASHEATLPVGYWVIDSDTGLPQIWDGSQWTDFSGTAIS